MSAGAGIAADPSDCSRGAAEAKTLVPNQGTVVAWSAPSQDFGVLVGENLEASTRVSIPSWMIPGRPTVWWRPQRRSIRGTLYVSWSVHSSSSGDRNGSGFLF